MVTLLSRYTSRASTSRLRAGLALVAILALPVLLDHPSLAAKSIPPVSTPSYTKRSVSAGPENAPKPIPSSLKECHVALPSNRKLRDKRRIRNVNSILFPNCSHGGNRDEKRVYVESKHSLLPFAQRHTSVARRRFVAAWFLPADRVSTGGENDRRRWLRRVGRVLFFTVGDPGLALFGGQVPR